MELRRAPVIENNRGLGALTDQLAKFAEGKIPRWWLILFSIVRILRHGDFAGGHHL